MIEVERPRAYALLAEMLSLLRAWSERTELAETLEILATLAAQEGKGHDRCPGPRLRCRWADQRSRGPT